LIDKEIESNTEFRIKYPRGELGQSQNDLEQFMLIEELYTQMERMQKHLDDMANNKINIEFLKEQMEKAQTNIEKLKDADREIVYKNGNGDH
jgi:chaperonin cofactor prefoldin